MTYEEFLKFVPAKCIYETLYEDTEGRPILVISMLDAYDMVNKSQCTWVGLTDADWEHIDSKKGTALNTFTQGAVWAEDKLKERNNGY